MNPNTEHEDRVQIPGKHTANLSVRGFLAFIQGIFQGEDVPLRWSENPEDTAILIRDGNDDDPAKFEKLPAILVSRGHTSWVFPNVSTVDHRTNAWQGRLNQISYDLVARFFGKDTDEADALSWTVFMLLPNFMSLLGQYSGVSILGSPAMVPTQARGSDGSMYPVVVLQLRCVLMAGVTKRLRPDDGVVDYAAKRARMIFEASVSQPEHRPGVGLVREHLPAHALDLCIRRNRYGGVQVLPPEADRILDEGTVLDRDMELEEE